MSGYENFANVYDALTENVDYKQRSAYYCALLRQYGVADGLLLDLACGTGSMSLYFAQCGYDVIGVDSSAAMLSQAQQKAMQAGENILFLCQPMQQLDLYGTVCGTVCALDSLNHLTDEADLRETIRRVSLFTEPGGVFLFDVNTPYKHRAVLGNNVFVYDTPSVYCVWQNELSAQDTVQITLDFFEQDADVYYRSSEQFSERAYSVRDLTAILEQNGFSVVGIFAEMTTQPPQEDTQRIVFAAKKDVEKGERNR